MGKNPEFWVRVWSMIFDDKGLVCSGSEYFQKITFEFCKHITETSFQFHWWRTGTEPEPETYV